MSGIIRVKKIKGFFQASNEPFQDKSLSWGARGVMGYLLSKPDDWEVRNHDLFRQAPDGEKKVKGYLTELKKAGYLRRYPVSTGRGKIEWITEVYETKAANPDFSSGHFSPDDNSPGDNSPGDNSPGDKGGHILKTETPKTESIKTDTPNIGASPTAAGGQFFPETEEERLLLGSYSANTGRNVDFFPNALLQLRFRKSAARLGPRLNEAIERALSKPGISLKGTIDYLCKYVPQVDLRFDTSFGVNEVEKAGGVDRLEKHLCQKHNLTPELLRITRNGSFYHVEIAGLKETLQKIGDNFNDRGDIQPKQKRKDYRIEDDPMYQAFHELRDPPPAVHRTKKVGKSTGSKFPPKEADGAAIDRQLAELRARVKQEDDGGLSV